jgi:hypothetical protein
MTKLLLAAAPCLLLLAAGCKARPENIEIKDAWVRLSPVAGQPSAGYFKIEGGAEGTKLVSISSPALRRVELHESMTGGGMAKMKPVKDVDFDYRGRIAFEPGGKHAMIYGMPKDVQPGGRIPLTFAFNVAPPITIEAEVRTAGGESHSGH